MNSQGIIELLLRCQPRRHSKPLFKVVIIALFILTCTQMALRTSGLDTRYNHNVLDWPSRTTMFCGGNVTGYAQKFFRMKSVIYEPTTDSFQLVCKNEHLPPRYSFIENTHGVKKYIHRIGHVIKEPPSETIRHRGLSIIVDRCMAHNYYHTMQDWYNVFLMSKFFSFDFKSTSLFLIDRSPGFHTDTQWKSLFPGVTKLNDSKTPLYFDDVVFSPPGPSNPMEYWELPQLPFMEEFSRAFLSKFDLVSDKKLNCKNLTITLTIRRDYFLHPGTDVLQKRNTQRKFKNENELVSALRRHFPGHVIQTLVAEDMSLKEQLSLVVNTDIMAGMHGCALTNMWFMPRHGAIFEMYPKYWEIKYHYSSIARWRDIRYRYWRNQRKENEYQDHYTYVPPEVLVQNLNALKEEIGCLS